MDENNTYINKSEKEALEIMENVSDITSDQLQALRENEECCLLYTSPSPRDCS